MAGKDGQYKIIKCLLCDNQHRLTTHLSYSYKIKDTTIQKSKFCVLSLPCYTWQLLFHGGGKCRVNNCVTIVPSFPFNWLPCLLNKSVYCSMSTPPYSTFYTVHYNSLYPFPICLPSLHIHFLISIPYYLSSNLVPYSISLWRILLTGVVWRIYRAAGISPHLSY